ncbi:hypothetical protein KI387_005048, partial [Taxus chinensis]
VSVMGFENLREQYEEDDDFSKAYKACKKPTVMDRIPWMDYMLQEGLLLKGSQLCIPK